MPDETHSSIRRSYTSPYEQDTKRYFCGFCGTPLSYWSESPPSEADYISLTLGSLFGSDLRDLEDLGLLPSEALEDLNAKDKSENVTSHGGNDGLNREIGESLPWFETMVEGSRLGKMRRSWGESRSGSGRVRIEWEIAEWNDDDTEGETSAPLKRKIEDVAEDVSATGGAH